MGLGLELEGTQALEEEATAYSYQTLELREGLEIEAAIVKVEASSDIIVSRQV